MELFKKKRNENETHRDKLFDSDKLQIDLGLWMGVILRPKGISRRDFDILLNSSIRDISLRNSIPKADLDNVATSFLTLVKPAFGDLEISELGLYDRKNNTFMCKFSNGEKVSIQYDYGDMDNLPAFVVSTDKSITFYEYYPNFNNIPAHLKFQSVTKKLDDKDLKFVHYDSYDGYVAYLDNNDSRITIEISYKNGIEQDKQIDKKILEEAICSLSFDDSIDKITRSIVKGIICNPNELNVIKIKKEEKVKRNGRHRSDRVLEAITFKNGEIASMSTVRNGKTVTINDFSSWTYSESDFSVAHDEKSEQFSVTVNLDLQCLDDSFVPAGYVANAKNGVNDIKRLSLEMLKKD